MTPTAVKSFRHRYGLSVLQLSELGTSLGAQLAEAPRTIRRWEDGTRAVTKPAELVMLLAERSEAVRALLGLPEPPAEI